MKYLFIGLLFIQSCTSQKSLSITQIYVDNNAIDTIQIKGNSKINYNNTFLLSNFRDNIKSSTFIDSFVVNYLNNNNFSRNTNKVRLAFYKESKSTNLIEIKKNAREVERYLLNDLIYFYTIDEYGNTLREKFKNRLIVELKENNIKLPIPKIKIESQ